MSRCSYQSGLDRLLADGTNLLRGSRFALLTCHASVDAQLRPSEAALAEVFPGQCLRLLTPQHGLWGEQQANMIETGHGRHPLLGVPVFSLYERTRRPTAKMLDAIDTLLIDLQDVGTRVYTFIWTMKYCLDECASRGIRIIVLDRPNPVGGSFVEGPVLQQEYRSFVGEACIPMRHAMTVAELAQLLHEPLQSQCELVVVPMKGWQADRPFTATGRFWVPPSPNMPTQQTAFVYPGQVLLEGVNLSEGRGSTTPFEIVAAPFLQGDRLAESLNRLQLPGVHFLASRLTPTFDKWQGESCGAVSICVTDIHSFHALRSSLELLRICWQQYPQHVALLPPPYEYEHLRPPVDIIFGSNALRLWLQEEAASATEVPDALWRADVTRWDELTAEYRLYDRRLHDATAV